MIGTDSPMSKKLKRILNYVQLFTGGGAKSGSNLMIFASMIASQMFITRRHIRAYIWLFSNDGRKSSHTRRRQLHVFTPIRASCSIGQFGLLPDLRCRLHERPLHLKTGPGHASLRARHQRSIEHALKLFPPAPLLLGLVLGPFLEQNFRRSLMLSRGDLKTFLERPISGSILGITAIIVILMIWSEFRRRRKN